MACHAARNLEKYLSVSALVCTFRFFCRYLSPPLFLCDGCPGSCSAMPLPPQQQQP
ncbi:hypothetical protein CBM2615_A80059 [Cupriavidus taiwanensis]|uniref:Uncharacterized protein n=1 Tax=Cupriavidus taiwanensis TaxID=164546 RepID=A0A976AYQ5_9BURK|nr:hypothetical protein CBM2615_A80059 [Cupriavidus taiwanensis]SOZ60941.1 hypothetical protein CBM2614_A70058 [Cupriavidus taiwanensis]SOZ64841.1 hypothetical protein CBM2613_A60057 [Cupriavidus taiwanensis]SPA06829.1 hypothetical protein CBM2625_A70058 [Cupriavidus taiwanensis]